MDPSFRIDFISEGITETARFHGNIDAQAEPHFEELLRRVSGTAVTMDFSHTGRINSMGIALVLCSIRNIKAKQRAEVRVKGLNHVNGMLFKMTGIFTLAPEIK
jgi:anti-anti-sigma regulatory factor